MPATTSVAGSAPTSIFGSPVKGDAGSMASLFSDSNRSKFVRAEKPKEFQKKRSEITVKLDDEEKQQHEAQTVKQAAKKAKRTIKPMSEDKKAKAKAQGKEKRAPAEKESTPKADAGAGAEASPAKSQKTPQSDEKDNRTVFLGNLPTSEDIKSITKMCTEFGAVESVRLRSVPVAGTAVDEDGNQDLVKKVSIMKKKFGTQKGSLNAYVVFKELSAVTKVQAANNRLINSAPDAKGAVKTRHMRVDLMKPTLFPPARTVFIGALPHYADEEEVRTHFANVLPNGQDDIENIRLVRDAETMVGKGIGYLLLKNRDAVMQALSLHAVKYRKRWELRVTVCGKRTKRVDASAHDGGASTSNSSSGKSKGEKRKRELETESSSKEGDEKKPRWRDLDPEEQAKRKAATAASNAAVKRLDKKEKKESIKSLKTTNTRKRVLQDKGQLKKEKGRKGKRLGGNVKKAMKAMKSGAAKK